MTRKFCNQLAACALALYYLGPCPASAETDPPSAYTIEHNKSARAGAPFGDRRDLDFAARGYLGTLRDPVIRAADGHVVVDLNAMKFTNAPPPSTVNPSLWRQAELMGRHGLFRVTDDIFQVRGFDAANMTFVRGKSGWIVIDPLMSVEAARAAYSLVAAKLGDRPVTAILYTHQHGDHTGGAGALTGLLAPGAPVIVPQDFGPDNALYAAAAGRRGSYQFGGNLTPGAVGTLGNGIGNLLSRGSQQILAPTKEVKDAEELLIDGVRFVFQVTTNTEAPTEMDFYFPDWKVLHISEIANSSLHNIIPARGSPVRNARAWADGLTTAIDRFPDAAVLTSAHSWPRFGSWEVTDFLSKQRDAYKFLHDQTLRLINQGLTGDEIAVRLKLPPVLEREWYNRSYYGSFSMGVRAVYSYYMGWYDGNPVHLVPLPPQEGGRRYVEAMGGADRVQSLALTAYEQGDYAWGAELLNRIVMSDKGDTAAKTLLARCYEQLAWQSENAVWRNAYLMAAKELREGGPPPYAAAGSQGLADMSARDLFDTLATRLNAEKVDNAAAALTFTFPDTGEKVWVRVAHGVLVQHAGASTGPVDAEVIISRKALVSSIYERSQPGISPEARITGDTAVIDRFITWFDRPNPSFPIVTR